MVGAREYVVEGRISEVANRRQKERKGNERKRDFLEQGGCDLELGIGIAFGVEVGEGWSREEEA